MGCCSGCSYPYSQDHYYDSNAKDCIRGTCVPDGNGVRMYWYMTNQCEYTCPNLYANNISNTCDYNCTNNLFALGITG